MFEKFWDFDRDPHSHHRAMGGPRSRWGRGRWGGPMHGRGHGFGGFDFFDPPARADRGGVRYLVLDAIAEQPRHGYQIIQSIEERSEGAYRPSPGVVYPTLQLLEELGHAKISEQEARKVYAITDEGRKDLADHRSEVDEFYERQADSAWPRQMQEFGELMQRGAHLLKTFQRAARRGRLSPKTQERIRAVLDDAIRQIDEILGKDER